MTVQWAGGDKESCNSEWLSLTSWLCSVADVCESQDLAEWNLKKNEVCYECIFNVDVAVAQSSSLRSKVAYGLVSIAQKWEFLVHNNNDHS